MRPADMPVVTGELSALHALRRVRAWAKIFDFSGPPRLLSLGHDTSCNLDPSTCRSSILMADGDQNDRLDAARDRVILPFLRDGVLHEPASHRLGNPFASRHCRWRRRVAGASRSCGASAKCCRIRRYATSVWSLMQLAALRITARS